MSFFWLNQSEKEKKAIEKKRICKDQRARLRVWILGKEKKRSYKEHLRRKEKMTLESVSIIVSLRSDLASTPLP